MCQVPTCQGDYDHLNSLKDNTIETDSFLLEDSQTLRKIAFLGPQLKFAFDLKISKAVRARKFNIANIRRKNKKGRKNKKSHFYNSNSVKELQFLLKFLTMLLRSE